MKGFVGVVNLSSNQVSEHIKNKLFENFSANNDLSVSKVQKENFLAYFAGDNCYYYEDHKSKLLTLAVIKPVAKAALLQKKPSVESTKAKAFITFISGFVVIPF